MKQEQLGPYRIVRLIGRGGMGAVHEAVDPATGEAVAIKTLASHLADDPGLRKRFFAEIETLKTLVHPGIVRLLAFGEQEGTPYFAMELVRGRSLEERLRREGPLDWRRTVEIAIAVSRALKVAHDHGVVHRDLKPANILLGDDGSIKLADFGIARLFGHASLTAHGSILGTAEYMAPEQASGRPTDHRVDLYGLGASIFAMLTGQPPFRGGSLTDLIDRQQRTPPPRVGTLAKEIPPELDELVDRLLAKDPVRRPATALVLLRLFEAIDAVARDEQAASARPMPREAAAKGTVVIDLGASAVSSSDATRPDGPARNIDLLAATISPSTEPAAANASKTVGPPEPAPSGTTRVEPSRQTRFTTVEHLARAEERQRRRSEQAQAVVRGLGTLAMLAGVSAAAYAILRPRTADESHARIMQALEDGEDLRDVEPEIERFLARHGDDPRAPEVRGVAERIEIDGLERGLRRAGRRGDGANASAARRDYLMAMERAETSPSAGLEALEAWRTLHAEGDTWRAVVDRQVARLRPLAEAERMEDSSRLAAAFREAETLAEQAATDSDATRAREAEARRDAILESIGTLFAGRPHARDAVREAARLRGRTAAAADDAASGGDATARSEGTPIGEPPRSEDP